GSGRTGAWRALLPVRRLPRLLLGQLLLGELLALGPGPLLGLTLYLAGLAHVDDRRLDLDVQVPVRPVQLEDLLHVLVVSTRPPEVLPHDAGEQAALARLLERLLEPVVREDLVAHEVDLLDAGPRTLPDREVHRLRRPG